jgi:hypothetical protein
MVGMAHPAWYLSPAALLLAVATARAEPRTPNEFLAGGPPTLIAGTLGDARDDREVRAQIELIRGMVFTHSTVVDDETVDPTKGLDGWPERPVLYGGPHVNAVLAALAPRLPFTIDRERLAIGGREFAGREFRLIALVPALIGSETAPATPPFLLYAGCGMPGVAEINAVLHGGTAFLVVDRFGPRVAGSFERGEGGRLIPRFGPEAVRIEWRERIQGPTEEGETVRVLRPAMLPAKEGDAEEDAHLLVATGRVRRGLALSGKLELVVYVYPDRRSKASLTGNGGDGHADVLSGTIHVVSGDPGMLESLVVHEGTHIAAHAACGQTATVALAEGLAVAVSGSYGGIDLDDWRARLPADLPALHDLLGPAFRRLPEPVAYPVAGLLVRALKDRLGPARFAELVYPTPPSKFLSACAAAGLSANEVEALYESAIRQ